MALPQCSGGHSSGGLVAEGEETCRFVFLETARQPASRAAPWYALRTNSILLEQGLVEELVRWKDLAAY